MELGFKTFIRPHFNFTTLHLLALTLCGLLYINLCFVNLCTVLSVR